MSMFRRLPSTHAVALLLGVTLMGGGSATAQQVFATNVVIQGSLCVGFDCPASPSFGFDTIILRENNLRIFFDDTSTASGFPTNNWRITINDSVSGGASFFGIDDVTAGRQPFRITAGAPANSLFVASSGNVGLGTSTPVLELHLRDSDTPSVRLEQDASGGFSAQTWDVAGNEANFFVRDVTGGSRLPFRIRPGAPTSSIDIAASGNVGIGTASPGVVAGSDRYLTVSANGAGQHPSLELQGNRTTDAAVGMIRFVNGTSEIARIFAERLGANNSGVIRFNTANAGALSEAVRIDASGNVGIGTNAPTARLHTTGGVRFAGITGCSGGLQTGGDGTVSCLVSSRQFKTITGELAPAVALANVMALRPQVGAYKTTPGVPEHWLIAEDVAAVDPALAGYKDGKPYTVKTQNIVADLVAVIQHQQRRIEALEKASGR